MRKIFTIFEAPFFLFLAVPLVPLLLFPSKVLIREFFLIPTAPALFIYGLFIILGMAFNPKRVVIKDLLLSVLMLILYITHFIGKPMGDTFYWQYYWFSNKLYSSEILSQLIYHFIVRLFGIAAADYVPPVLGFLTAFAYFRFSSLLAADFPREKSRLASNLLKVFFLCWGGHLIFLKGFDENPQFGVPFFILQMLIVWRISSGWDTYRSGRIPRKLILLSGICIGLASLFHLQNLSLLLGIYVITVLLFLFEKVSIFKEAAIITVYALVTFAAFAVPVFSMGFHVEEGAILGANDYLFLPFTARPDKGVYIGMISFEQLFQVGNILLFASAFSLAAPFLYFFKNGSWNSPRSGNLFLLYALILSGGYLIFISTLEFDLGFPYDFDLMVTLGLPFNVYLSCIFIEAMISGKRKIFLVPLFLLGFFVAVTFSWGLTGADLAISKGVQGEAVYLQVEDYVAMHDSPPVYAFMGRGKKTIHVKIKGIPNSLFFILKGGINEKGFPFPMGPGTLHVGDRNFTGTTCALYGFLDDKGEYEIEVPLPENSGKNPFNIQAVVLSGAESKLLLTGAIYVIVKK